MSHKFLFTFLFVCAVLSQALSSRAALIYESGTLGETGIPWSDLENGTVPGTNVNNYVFTGVLFELTQPVITTQVGGHFVGSNNGTFFGAIVALDDADDFPNSDDLSTSDVLGATTLIFPDPSKEVFGDLELQLETGWYALVFGSRLFGTFGGGGAVRNGSDIRNPTYIVSIPDGTGWHDISFSLPNHRFVLKGQIVPAPSNTAMVFIVVLIALNGRRHLTITYPYVRGSPIECNR